MGFISVDEDITVLVVGTRFDNTNLLVPAVLDADAIGLHGKGQVLVSPAARERRVLSAA